MWYPRLLTALLMGLVIVACVGCRSTAPGTGNRSPFSQNDIEPLDATSSPNFVSVCQR